MLKKVAFNSPVGFLLVGIGLIATGFIVHKKRGGLKAVKKAGNKDALIAGVLQGFAVIPGVSRSGITMFALLAREFNPELALKLSAS